MHIDYVQAIALAGGVLVVGGFTRMLLLKLRPKKPSFDLNRLDVPGIIDLRGETLAGGGQALAPTKESRALYKKFERQQRIRELLGLK